MGESAKALIFNINNSTFNPFTYSPIQLNCILRILLDKNGSFETQELPIEPIKTNKISVCKTPVNSTEPLLYHKTTYRPWYDEAMKKIKAGEIFDEIFFNEKGELTEGARSNIILEINGKLFTPPVECGLLNGVLRRHLLQKNIPSSRTRFGIYPADKTGKMLKQVQHDVIEKITEKTLYLEDLEKAEKIFCINSVRGIVEVTNINKK